METINRRYIWWFFLILIVIMVAAFILNSINTPSPKPYATHPDDTEPTGSYYVVQDTQGNTIMETGLRVQIDDQYINEKNILYKISKIDGLNAIAEIINDNTEDEAVNISAGSAVNLSDYNQSIPAQADTDTHVVIYHTHTDESYIPNSKQASQPRAGDIYSVGKVLTDALQKSGVSVTHNTNHHDPHDINAYHRSRRTAAQLLKEQPDAVFDIHRDSTPARAYITSVNGVDTSRVMMVVGRSNPNMKTNLRYAKRIKAEADKLYPGLIRGIFMGKGSYNQDLYPTSILFEIGTDKIPLEMAENGARLLSDVIIQVVNK
ncbi:MAG: stage II sporulation protein P [Syntrophomonas sp.]|nr:stage II sporulation protein P [Syntrophomonas sp.]